MASCKCEQRAKKMLENHKTIREAIASFYVSFGTCITFSQTNKYGAVQFPQINIIRIAN